MRLPLVISLMLLGLPPAVGTRGAETEAEGRLRLLHAWSLSADESERAAARFREWTDAVDQHVPGTADPPAVEISQWPGADLDLLLRWVLHLFEARPAIRIDQHLPPVPRVVDLARRGTLLHADVALRVSESSRSATSLRSSPTRHYVVNVFDGQDLGGSRAVVHLEVGRALLSFLSYRRLDDVEFVSLWYRATSSALLHARRLGYAAPHVTAGLEALPDDVRLLFYDGVMHEVLATPRVQRALDATKMPLGFRPSVDSSRKELDRAEKLLARALKLNSADAEVHLHHGRILAQLDRHAEAAAELAGVDGAFQDTDLAYYAALFHGEEEAALGRRDAARAAFERAAGLCPNAQSPLLALSRLARRYGDRPAAVEALARLFALPTVRSRRLDPWWLYSESHVRDADALLTSLYAKSGSRDAR